jgi:hypothetical protein
MSRGRKDRNPAQLAALAQAREKAKIVIALLPCRKISKSLDQLEKVKGYNYPQRLGTFRRISWLWGTPGTPRA